MAHPLIVVVGSVKVQQGMLGGQCGIGGPAVLFAVGTVGGEVVEIGQGCRQRHVLKLVEHLV